MLYVPVRVEQLYLSLHVHRCLPHWLQLDCSKEREGEMEGREEETDREEGIVSTYLGSAHVNLWAAATCSLTAAIPSSDRGRGLAAVPGPRLTPVPQKKSFTLILPTAQVK